MGGMWLNLHLARLRARFSATPPAPAPVTGLEASLGNPADLFRMLDERLTERALGDLDHVADWCFVAIDLRNCAALLGVQQETWLSFPNTWLDSREAEGEYPLDTDTD